MSAFAWYFAGFMTPIVLILAFGVWAAIDESLADREGGSDG